MRNLFVWITVAICVLYVCRDVVETIVWKLVIIGGMCRIDIANESNSRRSDGPDLLFLSSGDFR